MSSQWLMEHSKQKWWEVWTKKHQNLAWQGHSLIFNFEDTSCSGVSSLSKPTGAPKMLSQLSAVQTLLSCFGNATRAPRVSEWHNTFGKGQWDSQESVKQIGNCYPWGVSSKVCQSLTVVGVLPQPGVQGLGPMYLLFIILKINK